MWQWAGAERRRVGRSRQNRWPQIRLRWIKLMETPCELASQAPGQTWQHWEKESLINSGCQPSADWGSGKNYRFLRRAWNACKPTHPGHHNQDSSQMGCQSHSGSGWSDSKRARTMQAPRSQPAVSLSPLPSLPHTGRHRLPQWANTQGSTPRDLTGPLKGNQRGST